jgi:hypothetical protein
MRGWRAAIPSSASPGPSGVTRSCSQFCSVRTLIPSASANCSRVSCTNSRSAATSRALIARPQCVGADHVAARAQTLRESIPVDRRVRCSYGIPQHILVVESLPGAGGKPSTDDLTMSSARSVQTKRMPDDAAKKPGHSAPSAASLVPRPVIGSPEWVWPNRRGTPPAMSTPRFTNLGCGTTSSGRCRRTSSRAQHEPRAALVFARALFLSLDHDQFPFYIPPDTVRPKSSRQRASSERVKSARASRLIFVRPTAGILLRGPERSEGHVSSNDLVGRRSLQRFIQVRFGFVQGKLGWIRRALRGSRPA